jgi:hypothetical protein
MNTAEFWDALKVEYETLAHQSFIGERRYNVHPGELRDRVCAQHDISRRLFAQVLSELHEGRERYQEMELIGAPPHGMARFKRNGMAMKVDGVWYAYIVIHLAANDGIQKRMQNASEI